MPDHTYDKKSQRNLMGGSGSDIDCKNVFNDPYAIYYHIIDTDYGFQCGYSAATSALTFIMEFVTAFFCGLYSMLLFVWKDKKCSKMLSYGTLWIPIVCQFMLLIQHASEIAAGSHECQLKQVQFQSSCSVLPFIFTPLLDSLNLVFSVVGFCCASIMFWCAPKVHKLLNPPENKKGLKKGLVGKDEEVFDPIGSMQKEATKSIIKSFFSSKK